MLMIILLMHALAHADEDAGTADTAVQTDTAEVSQTDDTVQPAVAPARRQCDARAKDDYYPYYGVAYVDYRPALAQPLGLGFMRDESPDSCVLPAVARGLSCLAGEAASRNMVLVVEQAGPGAWSNGNPFNTHLIDGTGVFAYWDRANQESESYFAPLSGRTHAEVLACHGATKPASCGNTDLYLSLLAWQTLVEYCGLTPHAHDPRYVSTRLFAAPLRGFAIDLTTDDT